MNIFHLSQSLKQPTIYLCRKNFEKIGEISNYISDINATEIFNSTAEMSFTVHKAVNGYPNPYWDDIVNLKLIYVYEYDRYYEIEVQEQTSVKDVKMITATGLCESELSQLNISVEVNTDIDIARDDYTPTILYNPDNPSASLLHRILKDKAPHYRILHVDDSLARLQRTFSIDTNIDDFLRQELSVEIDAYVEYNTALRGISLYDMLSVCHECGHRGNFYDICPECGGKNVKNGYGEWTNVYVSKDNLADEITLTADKGTIKNSFKVISGDDVITNAIPSVNPNGSGYLIQFSDLQYQDMPTELVNKLRSYTALLNSKKNTYKVLNLNIRNCINKILYYESEMMPSPEAEDTNAATELQRVTDALNALMANPHSPNSIGISNFSPFTTTAIADQAVLSYVKIMMRPGYQISISSSVYADGIWKGRFHVESVSDAERDHADSMADILLRTDGDELAYVTQKLQKALAAKNLKTEGYDFTQYGVKSLENFRDAYLSCMTILQEHGDSAQPEDSPAYQLYQQYYHLYHEAEAELSLRNAVVQEWRDKQSGYEAQQKAVHDLLDLQAYLGDTLYRLYCSYRREDKYENSNYLSDGLTDAQILETAEKLMEAAEKDLSAACQNQYTLTASVNNLFMMSEFEPFHDKCSLGNWIYVEVGGSVYSLRLIKIGIDYNSVDKITVEFSNVAKVHGIAMKLGEILENAQSIAASYPTTARQVCDDAKTTARVNHWMEHGLDATNMMIANAPNQNITITENGILCRSLDEITGDYQATQMRIIDSTIAMTDDDWRHTKTAFGKYIYKEPVTGKSKYTYGLIGETIVGRLLLGENLGIYNASQSMTFDQDGLQITNKTNTFAVNPNSNELLSLSSRTGKVLYVDTDGVLHIRGDGSGLDISTNKSITMKVNASDYSAQKIVSMINADKTGVQILGEKVNITGMVTFDSFDSNLRSNINNIRSDASDAKAKTDGLAAGTTTINGNCITTGKINADLITTGTIDANIVNVKNVVAASVAAENITGDTIDGKTIIGGKINGAHIKSSHMSGCGGDFKSIFFHDATKTGYQHGSICGQYVDDNGKIYQTEAIRINNTPTEAYMYVYQPMYFYNAHAYPIFNPVSGIRFGSSFFGTNLQAVPGYIKMIHDDRFSARTGLLMGFKSDIQAFEIYDDYTLNSHDISAKIFGNLEVAGTVTSQSALKYKTNITSLPDSTALKLLDYDIVSFDYIDGRKNKHGMIAEQAAEVSEYGVIRNKDNEPDAIGYIDFIPDIIKMNQIMYREIQDLKQQITRKKEI